MMRRITGLPAVALALATLALLPGCGADAVGSADRPFTAQALGALVPVGRSAPAAAPVLTRATVDRVELPLMLATIERIPATAIMVQVSNNRGARTFASADSVSITSRDGVILSTRAFSGDLMSAEVPSAAALARAGGQHRRVHDYLDDTGATYSESFICTVAAEGRDSVTVAERAYATRLFTESCTGPTRSFTNRHWVEDNGRIRQTSQWAGAQLGFLRLAFP